jgi:hypothetical protein
MRAHAASQLCSLRNNNTAFAEAQTRSGFFPLSRFLLHNLKRSRSACRVAVSGFDSRHAHSFCGCQRDQPLRASTADC